MTREHQRPILQPSSDFDWVIGSDEPGAAHRLAQETSWALLNRVRSGADPEVVERVVELASHRKQTTASGSTDQAPADTHREDEAAGIDDIAELWADASPHSLAGQLWRLYLLSNVAESNPHGVADLFRRGLEVAVTIDPVIAGMADPVTPEAIRRLCDVILRGAFTGDLAAALERASSYSRIVSFGATAIADDREHIDADHATELTTTALRYDTFADELRVGARRWRDGTLD